LDWVEIVQGDTRHIEIYCEKCSDQIEFGNILFQLVKVTRWILSNLSN